MATVYINPAPINDVNFLRWHEPVLGPFDGATFALSGECLGTTGETPEDVYALPLQSGDVVQFLINTADNFGDPSGLFLFLLQGNDFTLLATEFTYYGPDDTGLSAAFTVPALPDGRYNLAIGQFSYVADGSAPPIHGKEVILVSNPVRIANYNPLPTVWARFRHHATQFGYPYTNASGYYNRFRLDAFLTPARPVETISTYTDMNNNTRLAGKGKLERFKEFKTAHLDSAAHEAIAAMMMHSYLEIDGVQYQKTDAYETELETDVYALYQGQTKLKDLGFTKVNNVCPVAE